MTFGFEITASNAPRLMRIEQLIAYAKALLEEGAVSTEANPEYAEVEEALDRAGHAGRTQTGLHGLSCAGEKRWGEVVRGKVRGTDQQDCRGAET